MLFELLEFLLSTNCNAKVKTMTTVSAVMFEIVEMYIFQIHFFFRYTLLLQDVEDYVLLDLHWFIFACCMLKQNGDLFYF